MSNPDECHIKAMLIEINYKNDFSTQLLRRRIRGGMENNKGRKLLKL
jgi:hypothetical protein